MVRPEIGFVVGLLFSYYALLERTKDAPRLGVKTIGNSFTRVQVLDARMLDICLDVKTFGAMLAHDKSGDESA